MNLNEYRGEKKEEQINTTRSSGRELKNAVGSNLGLQIFDNQKNYEWLTTQEAADYLRISSKCLLNQTSNGTIRYFKFGRRNRFLLSDLKELLLAQPRGRSYGN
jgi:excisionase family DNA binding protein